MRIVSARVLPLLLALGVLLSPAYGIAESSNNSGKNPVKKSGSTMAVAPEDDFEPEPSVPGVMITAERRDEVSDPLETINRGIYKFNETVDEMFLDPVARGYRAVVPQWGRSRVSDFIGNLGEPVSFVNAVLQGDVNQAFTSFWRFMLNTTLGIGGLFDQASDWGLKKRPEDFDQTLAIYGAGEGSYIVLPLLGPTTTRGVVGRVADSLSNPFNYMAPAYVAGRYGVDTIDTREQLLDETDEIKRTSFDPYATVRSAYIQDRTAKIRNEK